MTTNHSSTYTVPVTTNPSIAGNHAADESGDEGEEDSVVGEEDSVVGEEDSVVGEEGGVVGEEGGVEGEDSVVGEIKGQRIEIYLKNISNSSVA